MFPKTASLWESTKTNRDYFRRPLTHEQGFHPGYFQDNTVKSQQLENSQPWIRFRAPYRGDLDNGRADGQNKVQPVPPFPEEVSPAWEVSREPKNDLDVECDGDCKLSAIEKSFVDWPWVDCTGGLYRERGEGQDDPKPLCYSVVVFEFISSGSYQATIDNTKILVIFSIDIDSQARRNPPISAQATLQQR